MYWNQTLQNNIQTFLQQIQTTQQVSFPFLVIDTPDGVQTFDRLVDQVKDVVWWYMQDVLILRDLSHHLEKPHILKVSVDDSDQTVETDDLWPVADRWARQINHRLSRAPSGDVKIVLIEHIHRMNRSAANALLKSFEEPLPGRLIIGTTTSAQWLMDTIRSRAMIMRAVLPDIWVLMTHMWDIYTSTVSQKNLTLAWLALTAGDIARTKKLLEDADTSWVVWFLELYEMIARNESAQQIATYAKDLTTNTERTSWGLLAGIQMLAGYLCRYDLVERSTLAQKYIAANVNEDNVWWGV